ncbi:coiled-coil domain-containing protein 84 isoform X1 [Siniperca chuatsi]|uniref:coiled-coil domain-containing protein 84 isoform X1 n=1 Tax=Siniperca chuatsi TaxID=119488 RepID=UPI001CE02C0E|nr:coiled-coil domain-containing protein 84 isoform X1 [Siniperca chuatsi]XP_044051296.1 coiled-coil domain-containing protein 84 isoform X1 [Siniperca chuatsi]
MGAYYCAICRQTTFTGKGHIFGKNHQSRLRVVLLKFLEKVKEARRTLKKPQVEKFDCTQHKQTFWCYCCGLDIERNVTDGNMTVLYGGLLEHMATTEHRKNTHKFWWDNKADPKFRDKVIITEEETERFKAEVAKALESFVEKEDEFIKQEADYIRAQEKHRQEVLQCLLETSSMNHCWLFLNQYQRDAEPEIFMGPSGTDMSGEDAVSSQFTSQGSDQQAGSGFVDSVVEVPWATPGQGLTFIGYQDSSNSGNVHTGAVPPWLQEDPLEGTSGAAAHPEIGPSLQDFLKQKEQEKLRKLPPNRVGANFDHSSHTDANWLPSFGRVWNSGRRWQSRHQFRQEEGQKSRRKRKREHGTEGSKKAKRTEQLTNSDNT